MTSLTAFSDKLCAASVTHEINPHTEVMPKFTEQLNPTQWCFSPSLISLYGTPAYEALTDEQRKRLSFFEVVNLFSFTVHGEKTQVEWLSRKLYSRDLMDVTPYLHHFIGEENNHMVYFGGFCRKYAGKLYAPQALFAAAASREYGSGLDDLLFFVKMLIFEELGDAYNVRIATDPGVLRLIRDINLYHHKDEARHLAFGREIVKDLFKKQSPGWSTQTLSDVRGYINDFIRASWMEFYNLRVYRDAGLTGDLSELRDAAFDHPVCQAHRRTITASISRFLLENGLLDVEPDLG